MRIKHSLIISCLWITVSGAAAAQSPPAARSAEIVPGAAARGTTDCAPTQPVPPHGTIAPEGEGTTTGQSREPLGDKLAKSDGVLCPPSGVDPEIHAPTPDTGNTPVIPPPGSPGGDPSVRPK
jgi:hypothetical protein